MSDAICIDTAKYKASLVSSLYCVILEQAANECSPDLLNLISIACDLNQQISQSLREIACDLNQQISQSLRDEDEVSA